MRFALEALTEEEFLAHVEDHGHVLMRDKNGNIDTLAYTDDEPPYCLGPQCKNCFDCWCVTCRSSNIKMCPKPEK